MSSERDARDAPTPAEQPSVESGIDKHEDEKDAPADLPRDEPPPEPSAPVADDKKHGPRFRLPFLGPRSKSDQERIMNPISPVDSRTVEERRRVTFEANRSAYALNRPSGDDSNDGLPRRSSRPWVDHRRSSIDPRLRPEEPVYHDSRAATRREYQRRATTLQEYYRHNPTLLPQLPFTFRHGFKRWKLGLLILFMVFDACVVPIVLYYAMTFGGHVEGWITFAVVTAIWGGPAYVEFAIRSWRLILKERFYRPLGVTSRWSFDITNWIFVVSLVATTAFLIVGAAPHIVWIRILALPGPALLLTLGGTLGLITIWSMAGWPAPFRISSTPKGARVNPGVYYMVEDIVAVNAAGGLPFREGLAARYEASPVFRRLIRDQSIFWSAGAVAMGIALFVIVCVHTVKKEIAYGVGWATPFVWAFVWAMITIPWVRHEMHRESATWDVVCKDKLEKGDFIGDLGSEPNSATPEPANGSSNGIDA